MAKYNVIDYDNQIIGEVDATDATDAWSKAGEKFSNVLDVRLSEEYMENVGLEGFFVYGHGGELIGSVYAVDMTDAWNKAREKFGEVSNIRQARELVREFGARIRTPMWKHKEILSQYGEPEGKGWIRMRFSPIVIEEQGAFWYDDNGEPIGVDAIRWENDDDDIVAAVKLVPEILESLREELEPYEYSGIIESGNIVVMIGDADGYRNLKVFPDFDTAFIEAGRLVHRFSTYDEMDESDYFDKNNYLALPLGGA